MSCVFCTDHHPEEIWRGRFFYVIDAKEPHFPCYLRIVACRHVPEMSDLTAEERQNLWEILNLIERMMRDMLSVHKINYAQFGNMVPHLHWHLIARWKDDTHFPECPWGKQQREADPVLEKKRSLQTEILKATLAAQLSAKFPD